MPSSVGDQSIPAAVAPPAGETIADRPYQAQFRIDKDGYVLAPTEPGLGVPIDHNALDKMMKRVDR